MLKWNHLLPIAGCLVASCLQGAPAASTQLPKESSIPLKDLPTTPSIEKQDAKKAPFTAFTGKISKNKVRMRVLPGTDSPIVKELSQGDFLIIEGEEDDFYAVRPPEEVKGYVFRTFVLEGIIEGSKVNVRMEPNTDSPVLAQLNSGDKINGRIAASNNKWFEISLPQNVRFWVSKDFVKRVGDKNYLTMMQKKKAEAKDLLDIAARSSENLNDFPQINYELIVKQYEKVISGYPELEEEKAKAETLLKNFKEDYTKRKIAYLEAQSGKIIQAEKLEVEKQSLEQRMKEQQKRLAQLEQQIHTEQMPASLANSAAPYWMNQERELYLKWMEKEGTRPIESFYDEQRLEGVTLRGTIEPYAKNVKNKPGDYLLVNPQGRPIAFLYSTIVNLHELIGKDMVLIGSSRSNNNFAFPAYFVISAE